MAILEELLTDYHQLLHKTDAASPILKPHQTVADVFRPGNEAYLNDDGISGYYIDNKPINVTEIISNGVTLSARYLYIESQMTPLFTHLVAPQLKKYILCTAHQGGLFGFGGMFYGKMLMMHNLYLIFSERRCSLFSTRCPNTVEVEEWCKVESFCEPSLLSETTKKSTPGFFIKFKFLIKLNGVHSGTVQIRKFELYYSYFKNEFSFFTKATETLNLIYLSDLFKNTQFKNSMAPEYFIHQPLGNITEENRLSIQIDNIIKNRMDVQPTPPAAPSVQRRDNEPPPPFKGFW